MNNILKMTSLNLEV